MAGAEEVISFSVYGIFDKPDSEMPIGQPCFSAKAYQDYMDWKNGKGRWNFLERTFKGEVDHVGVNKKISANCKQVSNVERLTDKKLGQETIDDKEWVDFGNDKMEVVIDLGKATKINTLAGRFLHYNKQAVALPSLVHFYISKNNKKFKRVGSIAMEATKNDRFDCWIDLVITDNIDASARYIKIEADNRDNNKILCDEIFINPKW
jgi:hypothetical protein